MVSVLGPDALVGTLVLRPQGVAPNQPNHLGGKEQLGSAAGEGALLGRGWDALPYTAYLHPFVNDSSRRVNEYIR